MMNIIPQPVKWGLDGAAITVGVTQIMGWWQTYIGMITATVGLLWLIIQAYFFFKDRVKK